MAEEPLDDEDQLMFRYALADLRQSALIACGVVAGFTLFTGIIVPEAAALLKAMGF